MNLESRKTFFHECPECGKDGCRVHPAAGTRDPKMQWELWCEDCGRARLGRAANRGEVVKVLEMMKQRRAA